MKPWTTALSLCIFLLASLMAAAQSPSVKPGSLPAPKLGIGSGDMFVYRDFGSTDNHFPAKALIASPGKESMVKKLEENDKTSPFSGNSCIACSIDLEGDAWGGWLYMYGYRPNGAAERQLNFGVYPECGYDLSLARKLTFMAKGKNGGEWVEFFVAGLGRSGETGAVVEGAGYPDSSPKISTGYIRLDKEWKAYTILLEGADLSYISCGFGFVTSGNYQTGNVTFYIDEVKFSSGATDSAGKGNGDVPEGGAGEKSAFSDPLVLAGIVAGVFSLLGILLTFLLKKGKRESSPAEDK